MQADVVLGISLGDEGKGKIVSHLLKTNKYDYCMRYCGGHNCGHTVIIDGKKLITHILPGGVLHRVKSIIGNGCVLNVNKFFKEIEYLEENGINCRDLILISKAAHIITEDHIIEDGKDVKIGTTKSGNGPAHRDKYNRIGIRAESVKELHPFLIDVYEELFNKEVDLKEKNILVEGAQGFFLDIDWGDYPYVTSAHCNTGGAISNGIPYNHIRDVWGVMKSYASYVGNKKLQPDGDVYERIQQVGKEFGATTGRKRQVFWNDINKINKAIDINGINILVINKMDVLREVGVWNIYKDGKLLELGTEFNYVEFMNNNIREGVKIIFSEYPDKI